MNWSRKDWWLVLALTALAASLRFFRLGELPPGFQFDEAFNAIDAQLVLRGDRPLFLPANAGREVLYTYWQALLAWLFGLNIYTLRLSSALLGILTIPVTYLLLRRLMARDRRLVAAGATLTLAISLWHLHFSRYGIRVISMPIIFSGAFGLAWLGAFAATRRTRLLAYSLSGILTGVSVWTHPTGRFAPFVLLLFTLWLLWQHRELRGLRLDRPLGGLLLTGVIAFIVFLPLGLEFYRHPEFFFGHASEVSVFAERVSGGSPLTMLGHNLLQVLGMFSFTGDREWTHGLAGRPVFDWPLALVFYLGLGLALMSIVRRRNSPDRDALILLLIWAMVMLFPSILSDAAPNYSRTLPALPALFVPAGLGLAWLARQRGPTAWIGPTAALLIVLYSTGQTAYDYFVRFAQSPDVYYMYDADKLDALDYLGQYTESHQVYLSQLWGDLHATVWFLRDDMGIKSLDTSDTIVLPPPDQGAVYAFPHEQAQRAEQVAALWPGVTPAVVPDQYDKPLLYTVQIDAATASDWPPQYTPSITHTARFVEAPTLLGMQAAAPDKQVSLFWRAETEMVRRLTTFIHLLDRDGRRVAQIDKIPGNGSYATTSWTAGERVIDRAYPEILDRCTAGESLRVQVGWYELRDGMPKRPRADSAGATALAGQMTLPFFAYPPEQFTPAVARNSPISPTLTLAGHTLHEEALQPGAPLTLDLMLTSAHGDEDPAPTLDSPTLRLIDSENNGDPVHLWQGPLAPGADWPTGLGLCRRVRTQIPMDIAPGNYQAVLMWPSDQEPEQIPLQTITVEPSTRRYDVPALARPISATLTSQNGGQLELAGVNTIATAGGGAVAVDLAWRTLTPVQNQYKVFVHLLNEHGDIVVQSDAAPADGYATNRWLPGEVVVDRHILELPDDLIPGQYRLAAGMYEPVSFARLTARSAEGGELPDNLIPLGGMDLPLDPVPTP